MEIAKTKENLHKCKCMKCPSYTLGCKIKSAPMNIVHMMEDLQKVQHFEGMYCAFEKSHCIDEDNGCLCDKCQIHNEYHLHRDSYCVR